MTVTSPRHATAWLAAALLLAGCATGQRSVGPADPSTRSAPERTAAAAAPPAAAATVPPPAVAPSARTVAAERLAVERRWLAQWFEGTPVQVALAADGSLSVAVPAEHSFDTGAARPRPALAAVLDKVAESLRRQPAAMVAQLQMPASRGAANSTLDAARADQVRRHLRGRGVAAERLPAAASAPAAAGVVLLLVVPTQPAALAPGSTTASR